MPHERNNKQQKNTTTIPHLENLLPTNEKKIQSFSILFAPKINVTFQRNIQ